MDELIPVGKIALPEWPLPAFTAAAPPAPESPKIAPLPFAPAASTQSPPLAVFQPAPAPFTPVQETLPDPIDPPETAWVPAPEIISPPEPAPAPFIPVIEAPPSPAPRAPLPPEPDFTDNDLREALAPLFKGFGDSSTDDRLEPMLRATIRRALAEYSPTNRPFEAPNALDRFRWRMQALFSSRTYEDILFEKTHRFQVEELFLVDAGSLALISYASANPGRHASTRRVEATVKRLALQARDPDGILKESFKLPDNRNVVSQQGSFVTLLAVVRGEPNEMAVNDLSYALDSIEARFCERFRDHSLPLLKVLQPFLEDCLLIQSPASAA